MKPWSSPEKRFYIQDKDQSLNETADDEEVALALENETSTDENDPDFQEVADVLSIWWLGHPDLPYNLPTLENGIFVAPLHAFVKNNFLCFASTIPLAAQIRQKRHR